MARKFIEKRIVAAGLEFCEKRIQEKGTNIVADDLKSLKVKTFAPAIQLSYSIIGVLLIVFGIWVQITISNMAVSIALMLMGIANICYAQHGRPKKISELEDEVDLMDLTADIVKQLTQKMDASRKKGN